MRRGKIAWFLLAGVLAVSVLVADSVSADWPCWRGPTHTGVAGPGPKLADAWPRNGPPLLWKSGPIACGWETKGCVSLGGQEGGLGSVSVAGGRAFVYVHWKRKGPPVTISTKDLNDLGWGEGIPDELGKKLDEEIRKARVDDPKDKRWKARLDAPKQEVFLKEFLASLDPAQVAKYGAWMTNRNAIVWRTHPIEVRTWDELAKIAEIRDKPFATFEDLMRELRKRGLDGGQNGGIFYGHNDWLDRLVAMGSTYTDTVICLEVSTGRELWRKEFPGASSTEMCYVGASGTPAICDGKCYASGSAGLYCLSMADGAVVWQAKTSLTHSSPLVTGDGVFLMLKEGLTAFDAGTGKVLWTQPKIAGKYSSVVPWVGGGKAYLLAPGACCVDPATGEIVWRLQTGAALATPVVSGDVMLDTSDPLVSAIRLAPGGGELLWSKPPGCANAGGTPVIYEGHTYQTSSRYTGFSTACRDLKTGEVKWIGAFGRECTSTIAADGKIFATVWANDRASLLMFKAAPEKLELLGLGPTADAPPEGCTPSIADGRLYVRLADCVACYDVTVAGNPGAVPPTSASVIQAPTNYVFRKSVNSRTWDAPVADKGDTIEIMAKDGKVTTVKKSEIDDVIRPGMVWQIRR